MSRPVRVLRVIARMNVGGPAYHVAILSGRMDRTRYETLLVAGSVGRGEASFDELAERYGAVLRPLDSLGPSISPLHDLRALGALVRIIRRFRPDIVHTHTAKAGALGRLAAVLALRPRPIVVHTFHGHVLRGYFGPVVTAGYRLAERLAGRVSDRLVAVSQAVADDLVDLNVAPRNRFEVIPLGLDLDRYCTISPLPDGELRSQLGIGEAETVCVFVGRMVPIKRIDVLLHATARARKQGASVRLVLVGDGELRPSHEQLADELGLTAFVHFLGFRHDLERIAEATDIAVLSSDNEGTPVALIEAAAAGRPAVATRVGGVADIVGPETGKLVEAADVEGFAHALVELAGNPEQRRALGTAAREHVLGRYDSARLVRDVEALYETLLAERSRA